MQQQTFIPNGKPTERPTLPMPVLRIPQQMVSGRVSTLMPEEKSGFKPVIHQPSPSNAINNTSRPPSVHPYNGSQYSTAKGFNSVIFLT